MVLAPRLRRWIAAVVVLLAGATVWVVSGTAAHACSCAGGPPREAFGRADVVFIGKVVGFEHPGGFLRRGDGAVRFVLDVASVQKGAAYKVERILSAASEGACGASLAVGDRYQVFAASTPMSTRLPEGGLESNLCSGNRALASSSPFRAGRMGAFLEGERTYPGPPIDVAPIVTLAIAAAIVTGAVVAHRRRTSTGPYAD